MSEKNMFDKIIPTSPELQKKRADALAVRNAAAGVSAFVLAILAIFALIGVVVVLFLYEFDQLGLQLFIILLGSFAGGTLVCALAAFFLVRVSGRIEVRRKDFLERCDSDESFFVGEGTLATFTESGIRLHAEKGPVIDIPYSRMRFISVCSRKRAREEGEWSVVIEVPTSYLAKDGKGAGGNALIQTDRKDRLIETIAAHGLELVGEERPPEAERGKKSGRFKVQEMFFTPDAKLKRRALFLLTGGGLLAVAGILVAIFVGLWAGLVLLVFGLALLFRGFVGLFRARELLAFYEEGMYWTAAGRTDSLFLKWEEIEALSRAEGEGYRAIVARCTYGAYRFPLPQGAWEFLLKNYPDKIEGE